MQKEIYEQLNVIKNIFIGCISYGQVDLSELGLNVDELLLKVEYIQIFVCGIFYNFGMVFCYWFELLVGILCDVEIVFEFCYCKFVVCCNSLMIILLQFGEIVDILVGLCLLKELGYFGLLVICNVLGFFLVCEFDLVLMINVGIEIGVVFIKVFIIQLIVLLMLVVKLFCLKGLDVFIEYDIVYGLQVLLSCIEQMLFQDKCIEVLVEDFFDKYYVLFLGCGDQYLIVLEGVLKLKEIFYIYVEVYAVGELKYGLLVLIDVDMLVIVVVLNNELLEKLKFNIEEVCVCGGQLYVFVDQDVGFVSSDNMYIIEMLYVEEVIVLIFYIVLLQLLVYYVVLIKGIDVDQLCNLVKLVMVE